MKKILRTLTLVSITGIIFSACKKDTSRKDLLVGTWKVNSSMLDTNGNGKADDASITPQTGNSSTILFNSDGTGADIEVEGGLSSTENFTWSLSNNDNTLTIVEIGNTANKVSVDIVELSSSKLTVENKNGPTVGWSFLSK